MDWFLYDNGLRHERVKEWLREICVKAILVPSKKRLNRVMEWLKLYNAKKLDNWHQKKIICTQICYLE